MTAIFKAKLHGPVLRKIILDGHRFTPQEALAAGIIDAVAEGGTTEDVLALAESLAESVSANAQTGVWGLLKVRRRNVDDGQLIKFLKLQNELYREHIKAMKAEYRFVTPLTEALAFKSRL